MKILALLAIFLLVATETASAQTESNEAAALRAAKEQGLTSTTVPGYVGYLDTQDSTQIQLYKVFGYDSDGPVQYVIAIELYEGQIVASEPILQLRGLPQ